MTREQYERDVVRSVKLLRSPLLENVVASKAVTLPLSFDGDTDCLELVPEHVVDLSREYHAVKKKIEYEKTWQDKELVQIIYPYAGVPLAGLFNNKKHGLPWRTFFTAMGEIADLISALHDVGHVHGDLSPNNILFDDTAKSNLGFALVDWHMLDQAADFLEREKGSKRTACWSPEHFCLASERVQKVRPDDRGTIYAEEMRNYMIRLLGFVCAGRSEQSAGMLRGYLQAYLTHTAHPMFQTMYNELTDLHQTDPASIGKYHDIRYLIDTIAQTIAYLYPERTKSQQAQYDRFVALCLAQNLVDRYSYLQYPQSLLSKLSDVLKSCANAETGSSSSDRGWTATETEQHILGFLGTDNKT